MGLPRQARPAKLWAVKKAAHYPDKGRPAPVRALLACTLAAALAGCGGPAPKRASPPPQREWPLVEPKDAFAANAVLMRAVSLGGSPYRYGGASPETGFDCSGLVQYVYRDILDLRLPRSSRDLAAWQVPRIEPSRLAAADLVFFARGGTVDHVGIYIGQGRFVHAPSGSGAVRLDHLDGPYWREHYSGARRVLR